MFKQENSVKVDEGFRVVKVDVTLPDEIALKIFNSQEKDDKLNCIVYALIQDFEDSANALNCLTACLITKCKELDIDPVDFLIYMIKRYREFEDEEKENV